MKYTIAFVVLAFIAGVLYLLAAPQYAAAAARANTGSVMEVIMGLPAVLFTVSGSALTLGAVTYALNKLHQESL
jgi:hypothetical protein